MVTSASEFFERLLKSLTKASNKKWQKAKARCKNCGNTWTVKYPKGGPENKLECPKCKKRDSEVIYKYD